MQTCRSLLAVAALLACHYAAAADIQLSHVALSNVHGTNSNFELGAVNVLSDDGHIASLDFAGMADFMSIERTSQDSVWLYNDLQMVATAAEGYTVNSLRLRGVLDVTAIGVPDDQFFPFSFYFESPGLTGASSGLGEDGLSFDWTMHLDSTGADGSAPFNIHINTALGLPWYSEPNEAAGYAAIGFRSITLDIETVPLVSQVPEPGTWLMLLAGLAGVGVAARRRKH